MKSVRVVVTCLLFASCARSGLAQEAPPRPSLTVADFATDRTGWMPPPHLGETLAELLTDRLASSALFRTVDREWLQSTADPDGARASFAVLLDRARSTGVDYLVAGSVTRLSFELRLSTRLGLLPPLGAGVLRRTRSESVIGLTIRVIDVRTGEVVASATSENGSIQEANAGGGVAIAGHVPLVVGGRSSGAGFQDRLLDEALQDAVTDAAAQIVAAAPRLVRSAGDGRAGRDRS